MEFDRINKDMFFLTDRKPKRLYSSPYQTPSSRLAAVLIKRISGAARKERWGKAFFQIAWTAGPVTYLGLQGGYYIAYGKMAPPVIFLYFGGYTLIAGLFALAARFIYNAARGEKKSADQQALEFVFDALPERIVEIRNLQLKVLDTFGRKVMAAKYLLENPHAGTDSVVIAIEDLLEDEELALMIRRIETYRQNGLYVRANELHDEVFPLLSANTEKLRQVSGTLAENLLHRIQNDGRSGQMGRKRIRGFLSRCYSASDNDDLNLMSLADAEEICILVFEIINGRSFPSYRVEYKGHKQYTEIARSYQKARRDYRAAIYKRNDSIRMLAELLYKPIPASSPGKSQIIKTGSPKRGPGIYKLLASIPEIPSARIFQERITESMRDLLSGPDKNSPKAKRCLNLYKRLYKQGITAANNFSTFKRIWEKKKSLLQSSSSEGTPLLRNGEKGHGVELIPSYTALNSRQILPFVRKIYYKLEEFNAKHEDHITQANEQKELAIDLLLIADDYLPLEEIPVQQAIETTDSAYVSRNGKKAAGSEGISWGLALVEDGHFPGQQALHDFLENLITFESLTLTDKDIDYLSDVLGADRDFLKNKIGKTSSQQTFSLDPPYVVPSPDNLTDCKKSRKTISRKAIEE